MMTQSIFTFLFCFQIIFGFAQGELLIVVQPEKSISRNLIEEDLGAIRAMAKEQEIGLKIVELNENAPAEIDFTPAIVFQNHLGRSIYKGRYNVIDRLTNFVRTAQWEASPHKDYTKENILFLQIGKTHIAAPIKITGLSGVLPNNFNADVFFASAKQAIIESVQLMQYKTTTILPAQARIFYMDFYPHRSADGTLFIGMSLYSMFSCVAPVFQHEIPVSGNFEQFEQLFAEAGQVLENALLAQLDNPEFGDGLEPIYENGRTVTFEKLGYPIPEKKMQSQSNSTAYETLSADKWIFEKAISEAAPALQFQFPAPLDHYAGEAKEMTMQLQLAENQSFIKAKGRVQVAAKSITMGDEALDGHILDEYILASDFPMATYDFTIINGPEKLQTGVAQKIELEGVFQMKGINKSINATGTVQMVRNEIGENRLHITGKFELRLLELFGIKGPDGPKSASDVLKFRLNFLMKPVDIFNTAEKFEVIAKNYSPQKSNVKASENTSNNNPNSIIWKASTKIYKAKGSFENWTFSTLHVPNGDLEKIEAVAEIDLTSVSEKSKLLVKHVKSDKFFDVAQYPTARFNIKNANRTGAGIYAGNAILEMKGITETVPFTFEIIEENPLTIKGNCKIDRKTFNIGKVEKKGRVSKEVEVEMVVVLESNFQGITNN